MNTISLVESSEPPGGFTINLKINFMFGMMLYLSIWANDGVREILMVRL